MLGSSGAFAGSNPGAWQTPSQISTVHVRADVVQHAYEDQACLPVLAFRWLRTLKFDFQASGALKLVTRREYCFQSGPIRFLHQGFTSPRFLGIVWRVLCDKRRSDTNRLTLPIPPRFGPQKNERIRRFSGPPVTSRVISTPHLLTAQVLHTAAALAAAAAGCCCCRRWCR